MKRPVTFDGEALRTFVAGIEAGSFAIAAQRLNRSTSAVSAHLKKLEQQCGNALVMRNGRHLTLTPIGEILLGYARRLLALNDEAYQAVCGMTLQGEVRFGMQEDFGETLLPTVLGDFSRVHVDVQIAARIGRNQELQHGIQSHQLDLALLWRDEASPMPGELLTRLPLRWLSHPRLDIASRLIDGRPLPLVMFETPCLFRKQATEVLDRAAIPWRVVFESRSLGGIWAAVTAGLGLTLRTLMGKPAELNASPHPLLPDAGSLGVALMQTDAVLSPAGVRLRDIIRQTLLAQHAGLRGG
ncbi:LysR substrate-binding domain-containing protein [Acerihabitans sp. KWT182]|uniref:LysR substrate-binding domain-containing protein n=1 Tax=Acerihabitans sp. KWT182 TaxID=3157919 RepID=A0AAU7Q9I0_9GAMM